jgi:3-dehydroquinate dehydratase I
MICVSIGESSVEKCLEALKGLSFAEIRMDRMHDCTEEDARVMFSTGGTLIATCRPGVLNEKVRAGLLGSAIEAGASYVDIEFDSGEAFKKEIIEKARSRGCGVIVSFHDYDKTPNREELPGIVAACFNAGADVAKIACRVHSEKDNERLLGLLDSDQDIVVIGMGEKGRVTRIMAPILGSPFTYATLAYGKETAEGQIEAKTLRKYLDSLREKGVGSEMDLVRD